MIDVTVNPFVCFHTNLGHFTECLVDTLVFLEDNTTQILIILYLINIYLLAMTIWFLLLCF